MEAYKMNYTVTLPSYSVGTDCYKEIPWVTRHFGKKAVVVGGKTAMEKAKGHYGQFDSAAKYVDPRQE